MVDVQAAPLTVAGLPRAGADLHVVLAGERGEGRATLPLDEDAEGLRAVAEFVAAAQAHLDASDVAKRAAVALQRARACPSSFSQLQAAVVEAKQALRSTHSLLFAALAELTDAVRRRPELGLHPEVERLMGGGLPRELLPLLRFGGVRAHFGTRTLLDTVSRHRIHRAALGERVYALKEYAALEGLEGLRECLQEAAILVRARHAHVAEVVAIHFDAEERSVFIQMPFYERGSLDEWLERERPCGAAVRRVLAQAAVALDHLHGLGVVHADIKPGNIFVSSDGSACLGDFDISVSGHSRSSVARRGLSRGFAAPEMARTGATVAADLFALGATIAAVLRESPEAADLARRLRAPEPPARPSVKELLSEPFFADVLAED